MSNKVFNKIAEELANTNINDYQGDGYGKQYAFLLQNKNKILQFLSEYEKLTGKNLNQYKNLAEIKSIRSLVAFYDNIKQLIANEQNTRQQIILHSIKLILNQSESSLHSLTMNEMNTRKHLTENKNK